MNPHRKELKEMGVTCYSVGQPYDKVMKGDGAVFEILDGQCILTVGLSKISRAEREAVDHEALQISINVIDDIIFMCFNFNRMMLFEAPFHAGLYEQFRLSPVLEGEGYILPIILVDNAANIIAAMRIVGLSHEMSEWLYTAAYDQRNRPVRNYDEKLNRIYLKYKPGEIMKQSICTHFISN